MIEQTSISEGIFIFLITISVIGAIGNSIVAFVYWRKRDRQTSTFFVLLLSINDLVICCILLPFTIYMEKISPIAYALALVHKATFFKIFDKYFTKESK
jgi:hypothetical protein